MRTVGESKAKGCGNPGCYRPGCWTGPRPPRDTDKAIRQAVTSLAREVDRRAFDAIYAAVYGPRS